ncbi:MAG: 16S rRNA (guanine(527)-N(7))-methyltransferase RsmG [Myxococcaceae bacterium]|nr:16S rRNA (guanine(527)-N(7))-methyltransferase RsmG [Myxococcaceae bacterium]
MPERLALYAAELLKWNQRVNLTAITDPEEVVEKHLLDSLAVLPELDAIRPGSVLDLGAGAGLPGVVWAIARPALQVTLVDAVAKKVAFLKTVSARLGLSPRVRAAHLRLAGQPTAERLEPAQLVVSRAFMDLEGWLELARPYVASDGVVMAMTGRHQRDGDLDLVGRAHRYHRQSSRRFRLPRSGDERGVSVWVPLDVQGPSAA